jgi:hypothetical protein
MGNSVAGMEHLGLGGGMRVYGSRRGFCDPVAVEIVCRPLLFTWRPENRASRRQRRAKLRSSALRE